MQDAFRPHLESSFILDPRQQATTRTIIRESSDTRASRLFTGIRSTNERHRFPTPASFTTLLYTVIGDYGMLVTTPNVHSKRRSFGFFFAVLSASSVVYPLYASKHQEFTVGAKLEAAKVEANAMFPGLQNSRSPLYDKVILLLYEAGFCPVRRNAERDSPANLQDARSTRNSLNAPFKNDGSIEPGTTERCNYHTSAHLTTTILSSSDSWSSRQLQDSFDQISNCSRRQKPLSCQ